MDGMLMVPPTQSIQVEFSKSGSVKAGCASFILCVLMLLTVLLFLFYTLVYYEKREQRWRQVIRLLLLDREELVAMIQATDPANEYGS